LLGTRRAKIAFVGSRRDGILKSPDWPNSADRCFDGLRGGTVALGRESMERYLSAVGAVSAEAFVTTLSGVCHISPAAMCLTLLSSGFGIFVAANKIADGIMAVTEDEVSEDGASEEVTA
jgi:hypothetical protein